jgi:hypothetical protein
MVYLRRRDAGPAGAWWAAVERYPHSAPGLVRELLRGPSVVFDLTEAEHALAWARAHPAWVEDPAPLYAHDRTREAASGWPTAMRHDTALAPTLGIASRWTRLGVMLRGRGAERRPGWVAPWRSYLRLATDGGPFCVCRAHLPQDLGCEAPRWTSGKELCALHGTRDPAARVRRGQRPPLGGETTVA